MENSNYQELIRIFKNYKIGFVSVKGYTNKQGEVTDRLINVGINYDKAKKLDIKILERGIDYIPSEKYTLIDWELAKAELLQSLITPDENRSNGQTNAYIHILDSEGNSTCLKWNLETKALYIYGVEVPNTKKILVEGEYKVVKSSNKTLAKNAIRKAYLKSAKYKMFIIEKIGQIKVNGETLEFE